MGGVIPEDVWRAANEAAADGSWNGKPSKRWVEIIAYTILAERKRRLRLGRRAGLEWMRNMTLPATKLQTLS